MLRCSVETSPARAVDLVHRALDRFGELAQAHVQPTAQADHCVEGRRAQATLKHGNVGPIKLGQHRQSILCHSYAQAKPPEREAECFVMAGHHSPVLLLRRHG